MTTPDSPRRLDVVTTGETPLGDVYGPPEELQDMVDVMRERGEPIPEEWLRLLDQWRENNDMQPEVRE